MARKDDSVKRVRRLAREMGIINEEPSHKKIRRTQVGEEKPTPGSQPLPTVLHPNMEGIIKISPSSLWYSLSEDDKTFILNYNRAIRHNEDKPELPKGVTIGEKQNRRAKASDYFDMNPQKKDGNDDAKEKSNATVPQEEQEAPAAEKDNTSKDDIGDNRKLYLKEKVEEDSSVGSIGSIEEGNLSFNPDLRKKVTFHLHGGGNEVEDEEESEADDSPRRSPRLLRRRVRRNRQSFTIVNNGNDDADADEDEEAYIPDPAMPALE